MYICKTEQAEQIYIYRNIYIKMDNETMCYYYLVNINAQAHQFYENMYMIHTQYLQNILKAQQVLGL